jgi:peptidoglycan/xylan/chitin deacetylase (PgdA/CDA1 family)
VRVRPRAHVAVRRLPLGRPGAAVRRLPLGRPGAAVRRLLTLALAAVLPLSIAAAGHAVTGKPATGGAVTSHLVTAHRTVVSFTFDDGDADQMTAARILRSHGMRGTFYIITGAVGAPGYLTLADLHRLAAAGNEIGGHTVSHLELTNVTPAEARRQVCTGRDILTRWGFRVTSFAYPGAAYGPAVEAIVRGCGFTSARIASGLRSPGCPGCAPAETVPPADPYAIRTPWQVDGTWTLADMQRIVVTAESHGGGWLPFVFHHICSSRSCDALSVRASLLSAFASWLASRPRTAGTVVRTVAEVIGGPNRPAVLVRPAAAHGVRNSSLATIAPTSSVAAALESLGQPGAFLSCWMPGGYGSNTARWQRVRDAAHGRWAERLTLTGYHSGGAELLPLFDLGGCSLPVRAGRSYQLDAWYTSTATTQFTVFYRDAAGRWRYWTSSPYFRSATGWTHAQWQTPPVPAGASGLSFGLSLFANGTLTTTGYHFAAAPPDIARMILDRVLLGVLAVLALIGATAGLRRLSRRRRRSPPAAGNAPQTTRPPAASGRPA